MLSRRKRAESLQPNVGSARPARVRSNHISRLGKTRSDAPSSRRAIRRSPCPARRRSGRWWYRRACPHGRFRIHRRFRHVPFIAPRHPRDAARHRCLSRCRRPDADAPGSPEWSASGGGCLSDGKRACGDETQARLSREDAARQTAARSRRVQPGRQGAAAALHQRHVRPERAADLRSISCASNVATQRPHAGRMARSLVVGPCARAAPALQLAGAHLDRRRSGHHGHGDPALRTERCRAAEDECRGEDAADALHAQRIMLRSRARRLPVFAGGGRPPVRCAGSGRRRRGDRSGPGSA